MSDGSNFNVLVNKGCSGPDGIAIDSARGHIYWTNMGEPSRNDGFIMRCDPMAVTSRPSSPPA